MWFAYTNNLLTGVLKIEKVQEIIAENKKNKVSALEDYAIEITQEEKTLTMRWDKRV
jgi:hypothetical protein